MLTIACRLGIGSPELGRPGLGVPRISAASFVTVDSYDHAASTLLLRCADAYTALSFRLRASRRGRTSDPSPASTPLRLEGMSYNEAGTRISATA